MIQGVTDIIEVTRETEIGAALALVLECHEQGGASRLQRDLIRSALCAGFGMAIDDAQESLNEPIH